MRSAAAPSGRRCARRRSAALSVWRLQQNGVSAAAGPVLVTGASGGVGSLAVSLLARLGYSVVASSGKADAADWLRARGAEQVVSRQDVINSDDRPLHSVRWAGAVDTVGGATLASVSRQTRLHGCVTACGLVGGADLPLTVYPFLLRGITLAGITSQNCPADLRRRLWQRLATCWKLEDWDALSRTVELTELEAEIERILAGAVRGRVVVRIAGTE